MGILLRMRWFGLLREREGCGKAFALVPGSAFDKYYDFIYVSMMRPVLIRRASASGILGTVLWPLTMQVVAL